MSRNSGHSTTKVAIFVIVAFFVGRFMQIPGLPETGHGPTITKRSRKALLEDPTHSQQRTSQQKLFNPTSTKYPKNQLSSQFGSFEELLEASKILEDRPPVPSGETGHEFYTMQPMQLLSWYPRAYLFPKFMDKARCEHVIKLAEEWLTPSGLAFKEGDTVENTKDVRTSQGTFLTRDNDPAGVLAWIEDKIAVLSGIPAGHGEAFNILRYENNQHYDSHYDAFEEAMYGRQESQRVATVLVYLSDVEEGGETSFLFEGKNGTDRITTVNYKKCDTGIKYKPRAGDALLFWSMRPDHTLDKHSLHGGCPVISGVKYTATKWIRDKCTSFSGPCLDD